RALPFSSPASTSPAASPSRSACCRCSASNPGERPVTQGLVTVSYIGATILFILALGGLSQHETARRGNLYGMAGMAIALLATVLGVVSGNCGVLFAGLVIGGAIGLQLARRVQMT